MRGRAIISIEQVYDRRFDNDEAFEVAVSEDWPKVVSRGLTWHYVVGAISDKWRVWCDGDSAPVELGALDAPEDFASTMTLLLRGVGARGSCAAAVARDSGRNDSRRMV